MKYGETETTKLGAKQSFLGRRFDLIPITPLIAVAEVLHKAAEKYGVGNWQKIERHDHLNHAINHIFLFIEGDRCEDHLANAICRLMFAYWCDDKREP